MSSKNERLVKPGDNGSLNLSKDDESGDGEFQSRFNLYSGVLVRQETFVQEASRECGWYDPDTERYLRSTERRKLLAPKMIRMLIDDPKPLNLDREPIKWGRLGDVIEWYGLHLPQILEEEELSLGQLTDSLVDVHHILCGAWWVQSTTWKERVGGNNDYLFYWRYYEKYPHDRAEVFEIPGALFMNKGVQAMIMSYELMIEGEVQDAIAEAIRCVDDSRWGARSTGNWNQFFGGVRTESIEGAQQAMRFLHLARVLDIKKGKERDEKWASQFKDKDYPEIDILPIKDRLDYFLSSQSRTTSSLWSDTYPARTGGITLRVFKEKFIPTNT